MTINTNADVYIELAKSTQDLLRTNQFNFPLQCSFEIYGFDSNTGEYIYIYNRNVNLQTL
jgi:20S proteasome alpha/beta subunit